MMTPTDGGPDAVDRAIHEDLALLGFALVVGREGASFFDNFTTCVNRGIADYSNTPTGRRVAIHSCDIGRGVVIDGEGALDWTTPGAGAEGRSDPSRIEWSGTLTASLGSATRNVPAFSIEPFSALVTPDERPGLQNLDSLRITVDGVARVASDTLAFRGFSDAGNRSITSIPGQAGSLTSLTSADVRRLVFDLGIQWLVSLLGESGQSGDHTHESACGVVSVGYNGLGGLPVLTTMWTGCPLEGGLFMGGEFETAFTTPIPPGPSLPVPLGWELTGDFQVGGAVPMTRFTAIEFSAIIPPDVQGTLQLMGRLVDGDGVELLFDFSVLVDD